MVIFYNKWKKYNETQLAKKNKMDLNIRKMTNHPPSPETVNISSNKFVMLTHNNQIFRIIIIQLVFGRRLFDHFDDVARKKMTVPFSIDIGNVERMHERCPKKLRMGTARMK